MVEDFVRRKGYLTLGSRLKRIGDRLQADVQQLIEAEAVNIQTAQYPLIAVLHEQGPMTVGDLVEALGISQPGVTRSVGQLTKLGVVAVARGRDDQRKKVVALTPAGEAMIAKSQRDIWPFIDKHLSEICAEQDGPLLDQLDILENALQEKSLYRRIIEAKETSTDD